MKNKKRMKEFKKACKKMEKFINKYGCPHDTIIITQTGTEFKTGEIGIPFKIRD